MRAHLTFISALSLLTLAAPLARAEVPFVYEVTMAAPDTIRVEVREAPVLKGRIVKLPSPRSESHGTRIKLPTGDYGTLIGPQRDHVRVADRGNIVRLDRAAIDQASRYGAVGLRQVVAVYRKSVPWSSGLIVSDMKGVRTASFRHFIYLRLDAPLARGNYTVNWPGNVLPPTSFAFDDKVMRASSIRANQLGHRADDTSKYAYLALWLPGGPENGALDFRQYGLKTFHIINASGEAVFAGPISLRLGPNDPETAHGVHGDLKTYTRNDGTTFQANRTGTYVFGLDYSAWRDVTPGTYRIHIPTLGTSDSFVVDDAVWHRAASASMAGLYHQRSGLALDGRFGYSRPECYTEKTGVRVLQSKMPFSFSKESGVGFVDFTEAAKRPWITDEIVQNAWGGYQAAGDWDRAIVHVSASYLLLDVFEMLPKTSQGIEFGIPASGEVLRDHIYVGKDFPDLVDEAVWNLDFFRRLQRPDGAVRGAIDAAGSPSTDEPCWLESQTVFAYAPDPASTFEYAAAAAKLAIVFMQLGEEKLFELYRDSAIKAWGWAERAFSAPDSVFGEAAALLQLSATEYQNRLKPILQQTHDQKIRAAGTLFRLTGEDRFNESALKQLKVQYGVGVLDGAWEYANAKHPKADRNLQQNIKKTIVWVASARIADPQMGKTAYKTMQRAGSPLMWGSGLAPTAHEASVLIRAHTISGDDKFLGVMQDGSAHILGANQIGMSFTTGLGKRWPLAPLHVDSIVAGLPAPKGITIYGWTTPLMTGIYGLAWNPNWGAFPDNQPEKRVDPAPARTALPYYEFLIEYPWIIISAEYSIHQTIATTAAVWTYLHGYHPNPNGRRQ